MPNLIQATSAAIDAESLAVSLRTGSKRQSEICSARKALDKLDTVLTDLKEAGAAATIWSAAFYMPELTPQRRRQSMDCYACCQRARRDLSHALAYSERNP